MRQEIHTRRVPESKQIRGGKQKSWGGKWSDRYAFKSLSKSDYTQWVIWVPEIASVGEVCFWSFPHPTVVLHSGQLKK